MKNHTFMCCVSVVCVLFVCNKVLSCRLYPRSIVVRVSMTRLYICTLFNGVECVMDVCTCIDMIMDGWW